MKTFQDIELKPHPVGEGLMGQIFFPNGYGVSIVRFKIPLPPGIDRAAFRHGLPEYASYTKNEQEWELAVLRGVSGNFDLCYTTDITNDVMGYLSSRQVTQVMKRVQELPDYKPKRDT
jgi:hypothetical protein